MARVFISYAGGSDIGRAQDVLTWLREDGHAPFLAKDRHDGVLAGEEWRERLHQELHAADAVVFLVSAGFNASSWCNAEAGIACLLGSRLLPLRVEAGATNPLLRHVQHIDCVADPPAARMALCNALRIVDGGGSAGWSGGNPYPGLNAFTSELARAFFGRHGEVRSLTAMLRVATDVGGTLLAVAGPSGCGKSSLLRAGLLPALQRDRHWLVTRAWQPQQDPLDGLSTALTMAGERLSMGWSWDHVRRQLDTDDLALRRLASQLLVHHPEAARGRLLLALDQAEELFTHTPPSHRDRLARLLAHAVAGPVRIVVTIRSEFLDDLRNLTELADVAISPYLLGPLSADMLRLAIEGPASLAGLRFERALVAVMVAETDTGEALPLLAFALRELADGRPRGAVLTVDDYDGLRGAAGALARCADLALAAAATASRLTTGQILRCLLRLVTIDEVGRRGRQRVRRGDFGGAEQVALASFIEGRLLVSDVGDDGEPWVSPAHEALLTQWPPLDVVIGEHAAALAAARSVERAAAEWRVADRADSYLWELQRLDVALVELAISDADESGHPEGASAPELTAAAREFVASSRRRARQHRERERLARRRARRLRVVTASVLAGLLVTSMTAAVIFAQKRSLSRAQRLAIAFRMVTQADALRDQDPGSSLQLGVTAYALTQSPVAAASLVSTLTTSRYAGTFGGHAGRASVVALAPDGRSLAAGDDTGAITVWAVATGPEPRRIWTRPTGDGRAVRSLAYSADGRVLAATTAAGAAVAWAVDAAGTPREVGGVACAPRGGLAGTVALSQDGGLLAGGCADGTVVLAGTSVGTLRVPASPLGQPVRDGTGTVTALAVSKDRRLLAAGRVDGTVTVWRLDSLAAPATETSFLASVGTVDALAFAPDGPALAIGGSRGLALVADAGGRAAPDVLPGPTGTADVTRSVAFSDDGHLLAASAGYNTGTGTGTVALWDITGPDGPTPLGSLHGGTHAFDTVAFRGDGRVVVASGRDSTATTAWQVENGAVPRRLAPVLGGHTASVYALAFAPDGRALVSGSDDSTITFWDLAHPDVPRPLGGRSQPSPGGRIRTAVFAPDGETVATGNEDGTVVLWDLTDRDQPRMLGDPLRGHGAYVDDLAFSSDGRWLATVSDDGTTALWDLSDRRSPRSLGSLPGQAGAVPVRAVVFAPDGHSLTIAGVDGTVLRWRLDSRGTARLTGRFTVDGAAQLGGVPTSRATASASRLNYPTFAPDGRVLVAGNADGSLTVLDLTDSAALRRIVLPGFTTEPVRSVRFSADGMTLAAGGQDGSVMLWDLTDRATPRRLLTQPLAGPRGAVVGLAFDADGGELAAGGERIPAGGDPTVVRWDLTALRDLRRDPLGAARTRGATCLLPELWAFYAPGLDQPPACRR